VAPINPSGRKKAYYVEREGSGRNSQKRKKDTEAIATAGQKKSIVDPIKFALYKREKHRLNRGRDSAKIKKREREIEKPLSWGILLRPRKGERTKAWSNVQEA